MARGTGKPRPRVQKDDWVVEGRRKALARFLFGSYDDTQPGARGPVQHGATWSWADAVAPSPKVAPEGLAIDIPRCPPRWWLYVLAALVVAAGGVAAGVWHRDVLFWIDDDDSTRSRLPRGDRPSRCAVFRADRSDAAGRDVDIPRGALPSTVPRGPSATVDRSSRAFVRPSSPRTIAAASSPRRVSSDYPRPRPRRRRDSSPRTIRVLGRGVAATRPLVGFKQ